jgi:transcriptional regulator with XRE-family HTH domain
MKASKKRDGVRELSKVVAEKTRQLREAAGLSQSDLAGACGWHQPRVAAIERGGVNHTLSTINRLATALNVEASELLTA